MDAITPEPDAAPVRAPENGKAEPAELGQFLFGEPRLAIALRRFSQVIRNFMPTSVVPFL